MQRIAMPRHTLGAADVPSPPPTLRHATLTHPTRPPTATRLPTASRSVFTATPYPPRSSAFFIEAFRLLSVARAASSSPKACSSNVGDSGASSPAGTSTSTAGRSPSKVTRASEGGLWSTWGSARAARVTDASKYVPEGFSKAAQGSIAALRVPFENFAGYVSDRNGVLVSPLLRLGGLAPAPLLLLLRVLVRVEYSDSRRLRTGCQQGSS